MAQISEPFDLPITITPADIDELGHVNNIVYLRWVQEAATAHWTAAAPAEDQARLRWIVLRHEIDYKRAAHLNDGIIARTWVGAATGLKFDRFTEILRSSDGKILAKVRTVWCPIDARTGKLADVSAEVRSRFST